jgi:hypothetical protein
MTCLSCSMVARWHSFCQEGSETKGKSSMLRTPAEQSLLPPYTPPERSRELLQRGVLLC